jgi:hypothetical protein
MLLHQGHAFDVGGGVKAKPPGRASGPKQPVAALPGSQQLGAGPDALAQLADPQDLSNTAHARTVQALDEPLTTLARILYGLPGQYLDRR